MMARIIAFSDKLSLIFLLWKAKDERQEEEGARQEARRQRLACNIYFPRRGISKTGQKKPRGLQKVFSLAGF
jgi:hypothetical protein